MQGQRSYGSVIGLLFASSMRGEKRIAPASIELADCGNYRLPTC